MGFMQMIMCGGLGPYSGDLAVTHSGQYPQFLGVTVYPWTSGTGFGTKYADPSTLPGTGGHAVAFSPDGADIAVTDNATSPYIYVYPWTSGSGFGTKYSDPSNPNIPTEAYGISFSPDGADLAISNRITPYIYVYPWTSGTGFGTKYANPSITLPPERGHDVAFSPDGADIAVVGYTGVYTTPKYYIAVYPWTSGTGFGTKYADPSTPPTGNGYTVAFSPDGADIAVAHATSPYVSVYPWTSGSGFGTKYADPLTLPTGTGNGIAFSPNSDTIAIAHNTAPYISVYPWTSGSGFGTKYSGPSTTPTGNDIPGNGYGVAFTPDGADLAVTHWTSPYITVYPWTSGTGFGTKYANPSTLPSNIGQDLAFSPAS